MSDLVVIAFPTEAKAEEVRQKLLGMQKEYLLELGDAVVAMKDAKGRAVREATGVACAPLVLTAR